MLFSTLVTLLAASSALAAPARRQVAGGCSTAGFNVVFPAGQTVLPATTTPVAFVTLGVGVQNYTCGADGKFKSAGAVADIFDISCLHGTAAFDNIQDLALRAGGFPAIGSALAARQVEAATAGRVRPPFGRPPFGRPPFGRPPYGRPPPGGSSAGLPSGAPTAGIPTAAPSEGVPPVASSAPADVPSASVPSAAPSVGLPPVASSAAPSGAPSAQIPTGAPSAGLPPVASSASVPPPAEPSAGTEPPVGTVPTPPGPGTQAGKLLGKHFFIPNPAGGIIPRWDFTASQGSPDAFFDGAKVAGLPAPTGPQDVDWLSLSNVAGNLATEVYRTDTRGGQPPASCVAGETVSVKYTSKYWLNK